MPNFCLKLSIFIILAALVLALFLPSLTKAQTAQSSEESFLLAKIQLLKLQVELLKTQLALLLKGGLQPTKANCAQLNITWERVQGATGYRLYREGAVVYEGKNLSFVDSGLALGKKYKYVVYGLREGKQGEPSEVKEITAPDVCPPQTPRLNSAAEPCGGNMALSWFPSIKATTYQVFRANREIYSGPLARFVDSGLRPNTAYEYKIRAGNPGGWSGFSAPFTFQSSNVCAPSSVQVSSVIPTAVSEGVLLMEMKRSPANNTSVRPSTDERTTTGSVMAFDVKARFSDITITRIDLFFDSPAWLYLDKIAIRFGGRTIAEKEVSQESFTRIGPEHIYQLRFGGFSAIVKDDKKSTFTVRVTTKESFPAPLPRNITVFLENGSVRGVDKAGIFHLVPVSGGGKGGVFSRTFRIEVE